MNPTKCDSLKFTLSAREVKNRFCKVYENVISNYFTFNEDLISGAKKILDSKKERKKFKTDSPSYQLAFLLSFGVQDTCTVARKFYESIKNHTNVIKKLSENDPIKLLCLESESLPAVVGVCQVINEIVKEFGLGGKFDYSVIQISIIDNRGKWKRLCLHIIDAVNSYFTNIELKLYFVNWSSQEFIDTIKELDIMIVARFFAGDRCFTEHYNHMKIVLNEMKEDSIFFYFDSCNERYYAKLKRLISKTSFSEAKGCEKLHALFEDLEDKEYYLDLPVSWDTDFQCVMFSTWIKAAVQKTSFPETKTAIAEISTSSTGKMITTNQADGTVLPRNGNVSSTVLKANISQKKKEAKSSKKSTKTNSESTVSKEESKTKSMNKKSPTTATPEVQSETAIPVNLPKKLIDKQAQTSTTPEVQTEKSFGFNLPKKSSKKNAALTKKSTKNNPTEKVKLTGKFARMDLEKKNKDERHKMRAKNASFAKHANFYYDD